MREMWGWLMVHGRWLVLAMMLVSGAAWGQVKWERSYEAARKVAAWSGKPILIDFFAMWCGPCRQLEEETFTDPGVKELLERTVCLRVDVDREPALAARYGVTSLPRVLLMPPGEGGPRMDLLGFHDAKSFAQELRRALGLRPSEPASPNHPERERVRRALQQGQYAALKASHPKVAALGLDRMVAELGVFKEEHLPPLATLIRGAGSDAVPALIRGMGHPHLAVRAGSYRTLQTILREKKLAGPAPFDPWAPAKTRQSQLRQWMGWWKARQSQH